MAVDTTIGLFQRARLDNYLSNADQFWAHLSQLWPRAAEQLKEVGIFLPDIGAALEVGKEYLVSSHVGEFSIVPRYVVSNGDLLPALAFTDNDWTLPAPNMRRLYSVRTSPKDYMTELVGIDGHVLSQNAEDMSWTVIANLIRRVTAIKLEFDSASLL